MSSPRAAKPRVRGDQLIGFARQAIADLDPEALVAKALLRDVPENRATTVLALGKAAEAMVRGARAALGRSIKEVVCAGPGWGSHPLPDEGSLAAGEALLAAARAAGPDERVVALISGGGSSLAEALPPPITLAELRETHRVLIASGVSIDDINVVRKHISRLKGGRLAQAAAPAEVETFVLSDVVSGDIASVASGPTVIDPSSYHDALAVIAGLEIPTSVREHLERGARGGVGAPPTWLLGRVTVLADNRALVSFAAAAAQRAGLEIREIPYPLVGDPIRIAERLAEHLGEPGVLVVAGGEPTPTIRKDAGRGGRAQHLALLLAERLVGRAGALAVAIGSDGVDGPSGGAGGAVSSATAAELVGAGIDIGRAIARFDSASALRAVGAQIPASPTGSNLADLVLVWTGDG